MTWIVEHWAVITGVLYLAVNVLNAATKHWSEHEGLAKVATFVTEVLSIITSAGVASWLKAPLTSRAPGSPSGGAGPLVTLLTVALVSATLAGCASLPAQIDRANTALRAAGELALPVFKARCLNAAERCGDNHVSSVDCEEWQRCDGQREMISRLLDAGQVACVAAMVYAVEGKDQDARGRLAAALEALGKAEEVMTATGVLR